jgi:hypothetical protein
MQVQASRSVPLTSTYIYKTIDFFIRLIIHLFMSFMQIFLQNNTLTS